MDKGRWKAVNEIFHAALEVSTSERGEFVSKASGDDLSLAEEVNQLLRADDEAGSYIESPVVNGSLLRSAISTLAPALAAGDLLCGRFRILRTVGEGGMGHVFAALDEELGVHVALKIIRPEIASNREALARFRQEVRLARRITHANVCRTFDINRETRVVDERSGVSVEFVFLTMEFLEGETLAEKIAREGPLPLDLAADVAHQVADALQAAHVLGVIHRDIKPSNIMLAPATSCAHGIRAVVTDFGLARAENLDSLRSLSGISNRANPIGTLAYMAPEQLSGAPISVATDVYAFGLLLFEMATGKRAFPSNALLSGITLRLAGPPPDPSAYVSDLPDSWRSAIAGCLQIRPEERIPTVADAVAVLDGERNHSALRLTGVRAGLRTWLTWRRAIMALFIGGAAVSLFWAGLRFSFLRADAKVAPGALVYLAPVKNQTGEKALDNITELIQAGLAQSTQINLLDQGRVGDTLQRMTRPPDTVIDEPTAREIAMRTGAVRVVFATVNGSQGNYRLDVDVQQPDNDPKRYREHWKKEFTWQSARSAGSATIPQDLLVAVRNANDWIRKEAGESANDIARLDVPPEDATTGNWEALSEYSEAQRQLALGDKESAIRKLQRATVIDPHFALAYAKLADNLMSVFRAEESLAAYEQATSLEQNSRLTPRERFFIIASHASDTDDFQVAIDSFKDYTDLYPHDYLGWFYLAFPLTEVGRPEEALVALHRSLELEPKGGGTRAMIALTQLAAGRPKDAEATSREIRKAGYVDEAFYTLGIEDFLQGRFENAKRDFLTLQSASASQVYKAFGYSMLARVLSEQGYWNDALRELERGIRECGQVGDNSDAAGMEFDKAWILARLGHFNEAFSTLDTVSEKKVDPLHITEEALALESAAEYGPSAVRVESNRRLQHLLEVAKRHLRDLSIQIAVHKIQADGYALEGNWNSARYESNIASNLEAPTRDKAYLASILSKVADHADDQAKASELRDEAMRAYEVTLARPAYSWREAWAYPPGYLAEEASAALMLCNEHLGERLESCRSAKTEYDSLRGGHFHN